MPLCRQQAELLTYAALLLMLRQRRPQRRADDLRFQRSKHLLRLLALLLCRGFCLLQRLCRLFARLQRLLLLFQLALQLLLLRAELRQRLLTLFKPGEFGMPARQFAAPAGDSGFTQAKRLLLRQLLL